MRGFCSFCSLSYFIVVENIYIDLAQQIAKCEGGKKLNLVAVVVFDVVVGNVGLLSYQ